VEYKELEINLAAGSYLEEMREAGDYARLHGTASLELKPWIFDIGWGIDGARFYQNFVVSAGVDIGKLARKLDLIPPRPDYPYGRLIPSPARESDQGLGHALDGGWVQRDDGVVSVGLKMPGKIRNGVVNAPTSVKQLGHDVVDTISNLPGDISNESLELWRRGQEQFGPKAGPSPVPGRAQ
jgi:hypothetical protein